MSEIVLSKMSRAAESIRAVFAPGPVESALTAQDSAAPIESKAAISNKAKFFCSLGVGIALGAALVWGLQTMTSAAIDSHYSARAFEIAGTPTAPPELFVEEPADSNAASTVQPGE